MKQFSVQEIQKLIEAQIANPEFASALLSSLKVEGINSLKEALPSEIAFFFSKNYQNDLFQTKAGVVVTGSAFVKAVEAANPPAWKTAVFLICDDPYRAMGIATAEFSKFLSSHDHQVHSSLENQIHPTAIIGSNVKLGVGVDVGAHSVIESGSQIGDGVKIYPQCYVGKGASIGKDSVLFPRVTLYEKTSIGERCRIHSGAVIGADGFGYAPIKDPITKKTVDHQKIYHLGNVVIENDVEIGANTTIDRGTFGSTLIHSKVKIDNQVQVGHNCEIGEGSILCGAAGMAGSSSLGKFVIVAAQSGTGNQVHVGDYSFLAAFTGVAKDCEPGSELAGMPARPLTEYYKILALQNKLLRERGKDRKKS
jgi:UDP-3-O-[3-hydroxymyristoyl] glucosamine N-acyltransferase